MPTPFQEGIGGLLYHHSAQPNPFSIHPGPLKSWLTAVTSVMWCCHGNRHTCHHCPSWTSVGWHLGTQLLSLLKLVSYSVWWIFPFSSWTFHVQWSAVYCDWTIEPALIYLKLEEHYILSFWSLVPVNLSILRRTLHTFSLKFCSGKLICLKLEEHYFHSEVYFP